MSIAMAQEQTMGQGPKGQGDKEWERKERAKEYRIAARREKRNRKADEKKQRKLNATILRRMTRNPDKYHKNADRNRLRAIEMERRRIWSSAIRQAQNLAADHDPSGVSFNVEAVVKLPDGRIVTEASIRRREEKEAQEALRKEAEEKGLPFTPVTNGDVDGLSKREGTTRTFPAGMSKRQQKKLLLLEPRPAPPKPVLPEGIALPTGEEDWLALWDLPDDQLERRVTRDKRRKANERKALRVKQKSGKAERRLARDEKRQVYRDIKLEWKTIKEETTRWRARMKAIEDEESKRIADLVNVHDRKTALAVCASLGFTLENTPGVADIKPKALGMKGQHVDFDMIEQSEKHADIQVKTKPMGKRVDLSAAAPDSQARYITADQTGGGREEGDFINLGVGEEDWEHRILQWNHRTRRKLRRALDTADIEKEALVRQRAIDYYKEREMEVHPALLTRGKAHNKKGHRILENGRLETDKQERVRARVELTEFNNYMKVLRKQAKEAAVYAGLKKHAEATGKIPVSETPNEPNGAVIEGLTNGTHESNGVRNHDSDVEMHDAGDQESDSDSSSDPGMDI